MDNCLYELPTLPPNLRELLCDDNKLTRLPHIPPSLRHISYSDNEFKSKPELPTTVEQYYGGDKFGYRLFQNGNIIEYAGQTN